MIYLLLFIETEFLCIAQADFDFLCSPGWPQTDKEITCLRFVSLVLESKALVYLFSIYVPLKTIISIFISVSLLWRLLSMYI